MRSGTGSLSEPSAASLRANISMLMLLSLSVLAGCDRLARLDQSSGELASMAATAAEDPRRWAMGAGADWTAHGAADDESGYSRLDSINSTNVARLGLAWSLDLPGEASLEATPLASAVYAVDGKTGKLPWKHDPEVWKQDTDKMRLSFAVNRGVAHADGRIFAGTFAGRLLALDAKRGELLWSVVTTAPESNQYITGAPRVMKNKVIIDNGGHL